MFACESDLVLGMDARWRWVLFWVIRNVPILSATSVIMITELWVDDISLVYMWSIKVAVVEHILVVF